MCRAYILKLSLCLGSWLMCQIHRYLLWKKLLRKTLRFLYDMKYGKIWYYLPDLFIKHNPLISEVCTRYFKGKNNFGNQNLEVLSKILLFTFFLYSCYLDMPHCFRWINFAFLNCKVCKHLKSGKCF